MWILLLGLVAFLFGSALIVSPEGLVKFSEGLNRMITKIDQQVLKYRIGVGICLLGAGAFLLFSFYLLRYRVGR